MWEAIRANRLRSWLLVGLLGGLLVLLGALAGLAWDPQAGGFAGAGFALLAWLALLLTAFTAGDAILLGSVGARKIAKADAPRLWNVVEEMTIAAALPRMPEVYVVDHDVPNAFAVGRDPQHAAIAVTSGLLKRLNRDELQGVVAHEIGHVRNLDIRFLTFAAVTIGAIALISDLFLRSLWYGGGRQRAGRSDGRAQAVFVLAAVALAILAPIAARLLYLSVSRRREYLADATAAALTRYPEGLASALEKIALPATSQFKPIRALAPLYIVNPAATAWSTHPPTEKRIAVLRAMAGGAGYAEYERAYRALERGGILGPRTLREAEPVSARGPSVEPQGDAEDVARVREVTEMLDAVAGIAAFACACGVRLKAPPGFEGGRASCPRCGRGLEVPAATDHGGELTYRRSGTGWQAFRCTCRRTLQVGPGLQVASVRCGGCGRTVRIE